MAEKRLEDMLWRNIRQIRSENDEQFARWVLEARSDFLRLRLRQEPALRKIYLDAVDNVAEEIRNLKPTIGPLTRNHLSALEKSLRREAEQISQGVAERLKDDLLGAVEAGASSLNRQLIRAIQESKAPLDILKIQRGFADVNSAAVEALWSRTHKGMMLSDRIWQASDNAQQAIRDIIWDGTARGRDAVKVARDIEKYVRHGAKTLADDYPDMMDRMGRRIPKNLSYEALRLARTEMSNALREGSYAAGRVNPSYIGSRWLLSSSHPIPDICDDFASADLYGLGPGGYPKGEEPPIAHPNCLCYSVPIVDSVSSFVDRLVNWTHDPSSDQGLEQWYNEIYRGQFGHVPAIQVASRPTTPAAQPLVDEKEWERSVRRLSGKKGIQAQFAALELHQQFKDAFDVELLFDPDFLVEAARPKKGKVLRDSMIELAKTLNRLPVAATRDNLSFGTLVLGASSPGTYGAFAPATGQVFIATEAFNTPPRLALTKVSHVTETLLHELGHAVHHAKWQHFEAWFEALWELPPERAGAAMWDLAQYGSSSSTPKELGGITAYGSTDPLEDFADTFRLLFIEEEGMRKPSIRIITRQQSGEVVIGEPHYRFSLLSSMLERLGWEVPEL